MKTRLLFLFTAFVVGLVTLFACSGKTVQEGGLVVIVTTDLSLADMNTFRIEVSQELEPGKYGEPLIAKDYKMPAEASLPATLSIAAGAAANQNALVRVIGSNGTTPIVLREAEVRIPSDRLLALTMVLSASCASKVQTDPTGKVISICPAAHESCLPATGGCGSSVIDPNTLPTWDSVKDRDASLPLVSLADAAPIGASEKVITFFNLAGSPATITGGDIYVTLPPSTNAHGIAPTIVWRGAKISPAPNEPQNFDGVDPIVYTVTAQDGSVMIYTVHVSVAALDDKEILTFDVPGATTIYTLIGPDEITVKLPFGGDATKLVPTIAFKGKSINPASGVPVNLTNPVTYRVTAFNGTTRDYKVNSEIAAADDAEITSFTLNGVKGEVNEALENITVTFTTGVDITNLTPSITFIGKKLTPASGVAQNFANPVKYTVTSEDGTVSKEYEVEIKRPTISKVEMSPSGGLYGHTVNVKLSCRSPGVDIRFTTDGSEPTTASGLYATPIKLEAPVTAKTIKARCFSNNYEPAQQATFNLYSVSANAFDGPEELSFGPTKCGTQAAEQTVTMTNSGGTVNYVAGATPDFLVNPGTGSIGANVAIKVQPRQIPGDYDLGDGDIVNRLDITFDGTFIRTVTLRQRVTCP